MVRSYTKKFGVITNYKNLATTEVLNLKINEALVVIQEQGGTIMSSSLYPVGESGVVLFHVLYEDNGNYDKINSTLRDLVFNFSQLKE